jgi:hypothetical protein
MIRVVERIGLHRQRLDTARGEGIARAVADVLAANPGIAVQIQGHAEPGDGAYFDEDLSRQRAQAVKKYLVDRDRRGRKRSWRARLTRADAAAARALDRPRSGREIPAQGSRVRVRCSTWARRRCADAMQRDGTASAETWNAGGRYDTTRIHVRSLACLATTGVAPDGGFDTHHEYSTVPDRTALAAAAFATASALSAFAFAEGQTTAPSDSVSMLPPGAAPVQQPAYAPGPLEWKKGDPIPPGYRASTERRTGVAIAGGVTLGVSWTVAAGFGIAGLAGGLGPCNCRASSGALLVPVVGPFIFMGTLKDSSDGGGGAMFAPIAAVDGALQVAGAGLLVIGLVTRRDVLVRSDKVLGTTVRWEPSLMPVGQSGQGIGVRGTW